MNTDEKRIALLIDADNAPASKIDVILAEVARHGAANVRRAYGNWKSPHLQQWEAVLHAYAIRPIQQFAYSTGKNASDMAMVIDAMDLLYAGSVDGFAIVSSDADFTPLVMRILTDGHKVYGFGQRQTPEPFINACSQFTYVESLGEPAEESPGETTGPTPSRRCAGTPGWSGCCAARSTPPAATTAGPTSAPSASRSATRPPSTPATTATASSAISSRPPGSSRSAGTTWPCRCATPAAAERRRPLCPAGFRSRSASGTGPSRGGAPAGPGRSVANPLRRARPRASCARAHTAS
nr:NYN domain-containing protein [Kocuria flava]